MDYSNLLLAIIVILLLAHVSAFLFQRLAMPRVMGEIVAGVILGPTLLGAYFPQFYELIFSDKAQHHDVMGFMSWFGLILMMFIAGFEIDQRVEKSDLPLVTRLVLLGTVLTFAGGWALAHVMDISVLMGPLQQPISIHLVIAIAVAITSIPVVSRIFMDLGIMQSHYARLVLMTATMHDLILWLVLSWVSVLTTGKSMDWWEASQEMVMTIVVFALSITVLPRLLDALAKTKYNLLLRSSSMGFILCVCLGFALLTGYLKINVIFGAFLAGLLVGRMVNQSFSQHKEHIKAVAMGLFVPFYFVSVGLKLDLVNGLNLGLTTMFVILAIIISVSGNAFAAWTMNRHALSNFNLAMALNARGGPGIVVASLALEWGIINQQLFTAMIILALLTSCMAGWWLMFVLHRRWPLLIIRGRNNG